MAKKTESKTTTTAAAPKEVKGVCGATDGAAKCELKAPHPGKLHKDGTKSWG